MRSMRASVELSELVRPIATATAMSGLELRERIELGRDGPASLPKLATLGLSLASRPGSRTWFQRALRCLVPATMSSQTLATRWVGAPWATRSLGVRPSWRKPRISFNHSCSARPKRSAVVTGGLHSPLADGDPGKDEVAVAPVNVLLIVKTVDRTIPESEAATPGVTM